MKNKTDRPGLRERVPGFKVGGNDDRIAMVQNAVDVSGHIDLCWNHFYSGRNLNRLTGRSNCCKIFDAMFLMAVFAVLFDGITACSVNFLDVVPRTVNLLLHLGMFLSYLLYLLLLLLYWVSTTVGRIQNQRSRILCVMPFVLAVILTIAFLPGLEFRQGQYTNYSMGWSVYVCFATVGIYFLLTVGLIIAKFGSIRVNKREALLMTLICILFIVALQIIFPEFLATSMALTMTTISIYINMENPDIHGLEHYHHEMVMGFATLVDNKDDSTGGHIRRSSAYAVLIAKSLRDTKKYRNVITRDYLDNLSQSAPMHDIGKIGIPDAILQKPGKLTDEEFAKMKEHPVIGGKIIKDTFSHLSNGEYENMAYQVAMYHHEKWNGKGYPKGLSGTDIPLCARIMAVADVFDAVSAKRCYRDAMPLEKCYRIIEEGRGSDFDPDIVDVFLANRDKVEEIYYNKNA